MLSALDIPPTRASAVSAILQDRAQESLPRTVTLSGKLSPCSSRRLFVYPSSAVILSSSPSFSLSLSPPLSIIFPSLPSAQYDSHFNCPLCTSSHCRGRDMELESTARHTHAHTSLTLRREWSRQEWRYIRASVV